MMAATVIKKFSRAIEQLNLSPTCPVAVAVSGGCDSLALTLLAKKIFNRVIGITVGHSRDETMKVGELVQKLGVEHHTVNLNKEPGGAPANYKSRLPKGHQSKSYAALLEACEQLKIGTLFVGHHHDDLNALFLSRLSWDGIMDPVSYWPGYPATQIVKPLLDWKKSDIEDVCKYEGVEVCASDNVKQAMFDSNLKKIWSNLQNVSPSVADSLPQLVRSTCEARKLMHQRVSEAVNTLPTIDTKLGCVYLDNTQLKDLPLFVQIRALQVLASYIAGSPLKTKFQLLENICKQLPLSKPVFVGSVVFIPMKDRLCIGKGEPTEKGGLPIDIGKPIIWDKRWMVTVLPLPNYKMKSTGGRVFTVNSLDRSDWRLARFCGLRKVRTAPLPHEKLRPTLPVVRDDKNNVVLIPHFQVMDRTYGLSCEISFEPSASLCTILNSMVY